MDPLLLGIALLLTYLINLPFGYWRAHAKRIGDRREWFLAVHAPVPIIFLLRRGVGAKLTIIPLFVIAFFLGQYTGGRIHYWIHSRTGAASRCLPCDIPKVLQE